MKKDFIKEITQDQGEAGEEQIAFFDQFVLLHQEGDYSWFYAAYPKVDNLSEGYQEEFNAFYDSTDEILKNMKFYEPQIWRGSEDGTVISFETDDLDGNAVKSEELFSQNKITMINIWGTYCGPCIEEMPELGVTYTNLRTWDGYRDQLAFKVTPTTYFIDSQGRLIGDPIVGASTLQYRKSLDELLETIQ